jgi:hypothetical protein
MFHQKNKMLLNFNRPTCSYFWLFARVVTLKVFILSRSTSIQNFIVQCWLVKCLHPSQQFKRSTLWNGWSYRIKTCSVEGNFSCMTPLLSFIIIYQLVPKLIAGTFTQTEWWYHKLMFFIQEGKYAENGLALLKLIHPCGYILVMVEPLSWRPIV